MPMATDPEWQQLALYAAGGAVVLIVLLNLPFVGRVIRFLLSFAMIALAIYVLLQHAPFDPNLARLTARLGIDNQQVVGREVRIRMSPDGHFWADVVANEVKLRMLVDSGATVTAISEATAERIAVRGEAALVPIVLRTANGSVPARGGSIARLSVGGIEASNLKVVVTPAMGEVSVLGMNFLSQLESWRVEGRTLILVPKST